MESHGWWLALVTGCNDWLMIRRNIWLKRLNGCDSPPYETLGISRYRWVPVLSQNGGPKRSQSDDILVGARCSASLGNSHIWHTTNRRHAAEVLAAENLSLSLFTEPVDCRDIQRLILPMVHMSIVILMIYDWLFLSVRLKGWLAPQLAALQSTEKRWVAHPPDRSGDRVVCWPGESRSSNSHRFTIIRSSLWLWFYWLSSVSHD